MEESILERKEGQLEETMDRSFGELVALTESSESALLLFLFLALCYNLTQKIVPFDTYIRNTCYTYITKEQHVFSYKRRSSACRGEHRIISHVNLSW